MATSQSFICREEAHRTSARIFTIEKIPSPNTEQVFVNGVLQNANRTTTNDYSISGKTITFERNLETDEVVLVTYFYDVYTAPTEDTSVSLVSLQGRKDLIHWCLRKLGAPVIDINVDEDQIEDRIDEALFYFRDYHFDGVERCYLHHQITASTLSLDEAYTSNVTKNAILTGQTSGAQAAAYDKSADGFTIRFTTLNGKQFVPGELVAVQGETTLAKIANNSSAITLGDVDNKSITLSKKVLSVTNIIPQESSSIGGNLGGMFDFQYQFALNNMFNLASTDMITYGIYKQYTSMWEFMFRGSKGIRFNRKTDRVYLDVQSWVIDQWVVLETWSALNPTEYSEIYSDEFVREYACALIKQQWGSNLKKFTGIQLPGGTMLNGQQIYDEASGEIEKLRERVRKEFELPPDFLVG